jgi:hypothetical protein
MPVACSLSDTELRTREATIIAQFKAAVTGIREIAAGYSFEVPGDKQHLALVFELLAAERDCCPFLTFELAAAQGQGPLTLCIAGPVGTKEFLKALFLS